MSHPTKEQLADYARGAMPEGMSLLVAAHLTYCPACRKEVERFELIGSSLMGDSSSKDELSMPSLDAAMAMIDSAASDTPVEDDPGTPLPMPVRQAAGQKLDDLDWKFRMPGLHEAVLDGYEGEQVSLMRIRPGTGVWHHTHDGQEATLILQGEMEDQGQVFRRGDVALADHNDDHHPKVIGDEICYCLVVLAGNLRFTGPVGRALNLFTR